MDAISLYQAGFKNVVATLGTAMTESHLNLIWRYFDDPVVCFDGDRSGQNAAHKISEKLIAYMKPNYSLSFLILPNGFDPDSFVRKNGRNNFESLLDQKIDLLMNNHLKHIEDKINTIYKVLWLVVTLSIGALADLIVRVLSH